MKRWGEFFEKKTYVSKYDFSRFHKNGSFYAQK